MAKVVIGGTGLFGIAAATHNGSAGAAPTPPLFGPPLVLLQSTTTVDWERGPG